MRFGTAGAASAGGLRRRTGRCFGSEDTCGHWRSTVRLATGAVAMVGVKRGALIPEGGGFSRRNRLDGAAMAIGEL